MSRWRHIVLAFLPNLSVCPKPTAEKKHDPGPTDNDIKNVDIIPYAGPLPACALRGRGKAAASFNNIHASSGTKALPPRSAIRANATCLCRVHLGATTQWSCSSRLPSRDFAAPPPIHSSTHGQKMEERLLGVG
jgi:hypothetical protein